MIPANRIKDCWDLIAEGETEYYCSATPLAAAIEEARKARRDTGKRVAIVPWPKEREIE